MAATEDDLLELIGPLDPTRNEQPPGPGSDRYRSILAAAVGDTATATAAGAVPVAAARRPRRRRRRVVGVVAASLVAAGAVVLWPSPGEQTAEAAVRSAAEALRDVTSFEGQRTHVEPGASVETMTLRVSGDDLEFGGEARFADGRVERFAVTVVDRVQYATVDGRTEATPLLSGDGLDSPYGQASAALVAAVTGSDVTERGTETIAGVLTTRYDIALTARSIASLSSLPSEDLNWFDLADPSNVDQFTVWIAGDHVHRVVIAHSNGGTTRTTFFNLNGDVTITPPPGPYAEPDDG